MVEAVALADVLRCARSETSMHGWSVFGELVTERVVEFGVVDCSSGMYAQVQITKSGWLEVLLSNGYRFLDFNHDWEDDRGLCERVSVALSWFGAYLSEDYVITDGLWRARKYMTFRAGDLRGVLPRRPLVGRGPLARSGGLPCP